MGYTETFCDDCAEEVGTSFIPVTSLEMPVTSANVGESAVLCLSCNRDYLGRVERKREREAGR